MQFKGQSLVCLPVLIFLIVNDVVVMLYNKLSGFIVSYRVLHEHFVDYLILFVSYKLLQIFIDVRKLADNELESFSLVLEHAYVCFSDAILHN